MKVERQGLKNIFRLSLLHNYSSSFATVKATSSFKCGLKLFSST